VLDVLGAYGWSAAADGAPAKTVRHVAVIGAATSTAIVVLLSFGGATLYGSLNASHIVAPDPRRGCNGHVELCDRRLDQIVLAGTHNSMSASAERGWFFARQTGGVGAQLSRGVHAFLLDAHYGTKVGGVVRTDFASEAEGQQSYAELSSEQQVVLGRLLGMVGARRAPTGAKTVYFCHLYCELGATPAMETFRKIDGYLAENPNEVLLLLIEDHAEASDVRELLRRSGLAAHAYAYTRGQPLPTLREMIESRHNVLVMAENSGIGPWYQPAFEGLLQDTPFRFESASDFTCAGGRGPTSNTLLLLNHWLSVDPPSSGAAATANALQVLMDRVAGCRKARGRVPNIIAVDFYAAGNLFDVVDDLNGVARVALPAAAPVIAGTSVR
jgi:hypothetical protein